jgi:hypothetical protein
VLRVVVEVFVEVRDDSADLEDKDVRVDVRDAVVVKVGSAPAPASSRGRGYVSK